MKVHHSQDVRVLRSKAYPSLAEQVGALVKCELARQEGKPAPADALEVLQAVTDVKTRFPKSPKP